MEPGLPQYFRGVAPAHLLPKEGPYGAELAPVSTARAYQVIADLEFVLAARDQFPVLLLRAAHQGLAHAYRALGRHQDAAQSLRRSGLGPTAMDRVPAFTSFSLTARDGMRLSTPSTLSPAPNVHVAQSYDFGDFAFIETNAGLVAIDAGTSGAGIPSTDQRGLPRVGAVDIGAFESQGFTLAPVPGSTPQTSPILTPFAPLAVTVTANNPIEPVEGGVVNFVITPAADGASAIGTGSFEGSVRKWSVSGVPAP